MALAGHHNLLPVWRGPGEWQFPASTCVAGPEAAMFGKGGGQLSLPSSDACPELWRLLRQHRTRLASQPRAGVVITWPRRRGSAGWWWPPGKGSVANTLVPRRSGIALPSRESEISFLALHLPSRTDFCFCSLGFSAFFRSSARFWAPGSDEPAGTGRVDTNPEFRFTPKLPRLTPRRLRVGAAVRRAQ